jgi:hypothetical protein
MQKDKYWNYGILQIIFYFWLIILAFNDVMNSRLYNIWWSGKTIIDSKFVCGTGVLSDVFRIKVVEWATLVLWNLLRWEWFDTKYSLSWSDGHEFPWGKQNIALNRTFDVCRNPLIAMQYTCSQMYQNINQCPKLDNSWLLYPDSSPSRGLEYSWHSLWMSTNCCIPRTSNASDIGHVSKLMCKTWSKDQFLLKEVC